MTRSEIARRIYGTYIAGTTLCGGVLGTSLSFDNKSKPSNFLVGALAGTAIGILTPFVVVMSCIPSIRLEVKSTMRDVNDDEELSVRDVKEGDGAAAAAIAMDSKDSRETNK